MTIALQKTLQFVYFLNKIFKKKDKESKDVNWCLIFIYVCIYFILFIYLCALPVSAYVSKILTPWL